MVRGAAGDRRRGVARAGGAARDAQLGRGPALQRVQRFGGPRHDPGAVLRRGFSQRDLRVELPAGGAAQPREPAVRDSRGRAASGAAGADHGAEDDGPATGGEEHSAQPRRPSLAQPHDGDAAPALRPGRFREGGHGDSEPGRGDRPQVRAVRHGGGEQVFGGGGLRGGDRAHRRLPDVPGLRRGGRRISRRAFLSTPAG